MQRSKTINKLTQALAVFNKAMGSIKKDTVNTTFKSKYASLSTILENIAGPMAEAGLVLTQFPDGENSMETTLAHAPSGQFMSSVFTMKGSKEEPTEAGARISYMRRYSIAAVLCLNIADERPVAKQNDGGAMIPDDAEAEWINEYAWNQYMKRITAGEKNVFQEACKKWKMSDEARAQLKKAQDDQPKVVNKNNPGTVTA